MSEKVHIVEGILTIQKYDDIENIDIDINYLSQGHYYTAVESVSEAFEQEAKDLEEGIYKFSFTERYYSYDTGGVIEYDCEILDKSISKLINETDLFGVFNQLQQAQKENERLRVYNSYLLEEWDAKRFNEELELMTIEDFWENKKESLF